MLRQLSVGLALALILAAGPAAAGAILNTLESAPGQTGWSGRVDGLFSASGGNTEQVLLEAGGRAGWQGETSRLRLQVSGGYGESGGRETARDAVAHLRHNRNLGRGWSTVAFAQLQHNPFQRLQSRWLGGLGARVDLARDERGLLAIGATPMLEIEKLEDEPGHVARGRLSAFLHVARRLSPGAKLDGVVFWQPLFADLSASRAVANLTLAVDVTGAVDLKAGVAYEHNSRVPVGVEKTDWSTFTGLGVSF